MRIDLRDALADLAAEARPVDLRDGVLRRSRQIAVRRAMATSLTVVAVVAAAAGVLMPRLRDGVVPPGHTTPNTSASVLPTPSASLAPSASATPGPDMHSIDPRRAMIDIPPFPGYERACPSGERQFTNSAANISVAADNRSYFLMLADPPVFADLDGQPGDEALVTIGCYGPGSVNPYLLVALKAMPDRTLRTLGAVSVDRGRIFDYDVDDVRVEDRTVLVEVMGEHRSGGLPGFKQQRGYALVDGQFRQVSGGTTAPTAPSDIHELDPRNTTLTLFGFMPLCQTPACPVTVRFTDGVGDDTTNVDLTANPVKLVPYRYTIGDVSYVTGAGGTTKQLVAVTRHGPDGAAQGVFAVALQAAPMAPAGWLVTGIFGNGTTIVDQHGSGSLAVVTVRTASGDEQRTFRESPNQQTWERVS